MQIDIPCIEGEDGELLHPIPITSNNLNHEDPNQSTSYVKLVTSHAPIHRKVSCSSSVLHTLFIQGSRESHNSS